MDSAIPLLITSGLCCVLPTAAFLFGAWVGRNGIRLRSPLVRKDSAVGYK